MQQGWVLVSLELEFPQMKEKAPDPVPSNPAFQITLYEGKHFTGWKLEVFGGCDNFQDRGFMNRVNSIRVESGAWVCFEHPDFRGQQFILEHGDYPDFFRWNGHNDHMSSCRPVGMVSGPFTLGGLPAEVTGVGWSGLVRHGDK
ncbi:gamma-crystallin N-like [Loxodonta africana]|uniref:gamma-crystallin N-like n=1 Tax=Loxodonta africana TaxID=9785 RepID=UPI0030CC313C